MSLATPSEKMCPASNSMCHSMVHTVSWNQAASSSVSKSLRNRYIGFQSTKTLPMSKTGTRGSVTGNPPRGLRPPLGTGRWPVPVPSDDVEDALVAIVAVAQVAQHEIMPGFEIDAAFDH